MRIREPDVRQAIAIVRVLEQVVLGVPSVPGQSIDMEEGVGHIAALDVKHGIDAVDNVDRMNVNPAAAGHLEHFIRAERVPSLWCAHSSGLTFSFGM
jgi:hypothetical protein